MRPHHVSRRDDVISFHQKPGPVDPAKPPDAKNGGSYDLEQVSERQLAGWSLSWRRCCVGGDRCRRCCVGGDRCRRRRHGYCGCRGSGRRFRRGSRSRFRHGFHRRRRDLSRRWSSLTTCCNHHDRHTEQRHWECDGAPECLHRRESQYNPRCASILGTSSLRVNNSFTPSLRFSRDCRSRTLLVIGHHVPAEKQQAKIGCATLADVSQTIGDTPRQLVVVKE